MGRYNDRLFFECRIATFDEGENVAVAAEALIKAPLGPAAEKAHLFQPLDQVDAGGPIAAAPGFATFERVVGQGADVLLDFLRDDERQSRAASVGFDGLDARRAKQKK